MPRAMQGLLVGLALVLVLAAPGFAKPRPGKQNEIRVSWATTDAPAYSNAIGGGSWVPDTTRGFLLPGYAHWIGRLKDKADLWASFDILREKFSYGDTHYFQKGDWALLGLRSVVRRKQDLFWEVGAGWGQLRWEETPRSGPGFRAVYPSRGPGWQAAVGYRFEPAWRWELRVIGVGSRLIPPWFTMAFDF